jgi:hypothetical protein
LKAKSLISILFCFVLSAFLHLATEREEGQIEKSDGSTTVRHFIFVS